MIFTRIPVNSNANRCPNANAEDQIKESRFYWLLRFFLIEPPGGFDLEPEIELNFESLSLSGLFFAAFFAALAMAFCFFLCIASGVSAEPSSMSSSSSSSPFASVAGAV